MSCNGCRVLRKGCSENCMLRQCLQCIDSPQAQGHATLFVAKFFGRAGLVSFVSNVPQSQRPALFQSLLFEAVGRTISPVSGAVGLLWSGNWRLCQAAVETVLRGGTISAFPELAGVSEPERDYPFGAGSDMKKRKSAAADLDLCLTSAPPEKRRPATPSEESETTTLESGSVEQSERREGQERKLLRLFL